MAFLELLSYFLPYRTTSPAKSKRHVHGAFVRISPGALKPSRQSLEGFSFVGAMPSRLIGTLMIYSDAATCTSNGLGVNRTETEVPVKGYMLSMTKMMLGGHMDEVLEMVRSNYRHLNEVI